MKKTLLILIVLLLIAEATGYSTVKKDPWKIILTQAAKIKQEKIEKESLQVQNSELNAEILRFKKVNAIIYYYQKYGTLKLYPWITPEYLYNVCLWCEKYSVLSKTYNFDTFDRVNFALAWACNETNFNPDKVHPNDNKTIDYGLMQINSCNVWMFGKCNKLNPEQGIRVWFEKWVDHKCANQRGVWTTWDGFRKQGGKEMYYLLREVK